MMTSRGFRAGVLFLCAAALAMIASGCSYNNRRPGPPPRPGSLVGGRPVAPNTVGVQTPRPETYHAGRPAPFASANIYLPGSTSRQLVRYEVINGQAIFEGDIMLGPAHEVPFRYAKPKVLPPNPNVFSAMATSNDSYLWPGAQMPYEIDASVSAERREDIMQAVAHVSETALQLRPRTPADTDYVRFVEDNSTYGCSSHVGRIGGAQPIHVQGCWNRGSVTHEILHAAGFHHEQSREDRDNHVTIDFDAIDPPHKEWFEIRTGARLMGPYDYSSVMHYGRKAFSKNGDDTIIPKVPGAQIGQREGLSDLDRSALAQLYSGAPPPPGTNPPGTNPPNHGFAGQYTSQRGDVSCSESAGSVSCSFPGGSILCSVNGAQLDCGWLGGGQGRAVFTRQASGVLAGSYGNLLSNNDMGAWDLVPSGAAPPPGQPPGFSIPGFPAIPGLPPLPALPPLPPIPGLPAPQ